MGKGVSMKNEIFELINDPRSTLEDFEAVLEATDLCLKHPGLKLTPILYTLKNGRADFTRAILKYLSKKDIEPSQLASLSIIDPMGNTPLMAAIIAGDSFAVRVIDSLKPSLGKRNKVGETAATLATRRELQSKDGVFQTVLALPNIADELNAVSPRFFSALMIAVNADNAEVVRALMSAGARVDLQGKGGSTAILHAAAKGAYDCLKELVVPGIGLDIVGTNGITPLMKATLNHDVKSVKLLLEAGANPASQMLDGSTAIYFAVRTKNNHDCLRELVKKPIGLDLKTDPTNYDLSPLMIAVEMLDPASVQILVDAGADVDLQGQEGNTAIFMAIIRDAKEILPILAAKSSNLNITNDKNRTPLLEAISGGGKLWALEILLKAGADPDFEIMPGHSTRSLVHIGVQGGHITQDFCTQFENLCEKYAKAPAGASASFDPVVKEKSVELSSEIALDNNVQYHDAVLCPGFKIIDCKAAIKITGSINGISVLSKRKISQELISALKAVGNVEICKDGIVFSGKLSYEDIKHVIEYANASSGSAVDVHMFSRRGGRKINKEFKEIKVITGDEVINHGQEVSCNHLLFSENSSLTCQKRGKLRVTETILGIPIKGSGEDTKLLLEALRMLGAIVFVSEKGLESTGFFKFTLKNISILMERNKAASLKR